MAGRLDRHGDVVRVGEGEGPRHILRRARLDRVLRQADDAARDVAELVRARRERHARAVRAAGGVRAVVAGGQAFADGVVQIRARCAGDEELAAEGCVELRPLCGRGPAGGAGCTVATIRRQPRCSRQDEENERTHSPSESPSLSATVPVLSLVIATRAS